MLLEIGRNRVRDSALGRDLDGRVRRRLVALLRSSHLPPVERAAAGNTLARLGDPRFRADAWYLPAEPLLGFVEIPEGPFLMGSDRQHDSLVYDDEEPQHTVIVPLYYIARYPVTVAQWQAFVETSGYTPADARSLQGIPNHPVVYVNWHDALAYCDWLTPRLREWPATPAVLAHLLCHEGWCVTLPSEAEWEKAARGTDGRRYPWGPEPESHRANYRETGIGTTNTVGCFPDGVSPYGVEEMSGNVLVWTCSLWGPEWNKVTFSYPYKPDDGREQLQAPDTILRVGRGGDFWGVAHRGARCACRHEDDAREVGHYLGFRVVVRPCLWWCAHAFDL